MGKIASHIQFQKKQKQARNVQTTQHSERSLTTLIIITARALVKGKPLINTLLMPLRGLYHHLNVVQNDPRYAHHVSDRPSKG